jgi:hypothetical protein
VEAATQEEDVARAGLDPCHQPREGRRWRRRPGRRAHLSLSMGDGCRNGAAGQVRWRAGLAPLAPPPFSPSPAPSAGVREEIRRPRASLLPLLLRRRRAALSSGGEGEVRLELDSWAARGEASTSLPVRAEEDCKCNCHRLCWRPCDEKEMENTVAARQRPVCLPNLHIIVGGSLSTIKILLNIFL